MNQPHESQAAAMSRTGELPDGEMLRECINSGQVSAAQAVAHAEAGEVTTGWPADMPLDEIKRLSKSRDPNARALAREAAAHRVAGERIPAFLSRRADIPGVDPECIAALRDADGRLLFLWASDLRAILASLAAEREKVLVLRDALELMLKQFTKTPSSLRDSEARGAAHKALAATQGASHE